MTQETYIPIQGFILTKAFVAPLDSTRPSPTTLLYLPLCALGFLQWTIPTEAKRFVVNSWWFGSRTRSEGSRAVTAKRALFLLYGPTCTLPLVFVAFTQFFPRPVSAMPFGQRTNLKEYSHSSIRAQLSFGLKVLWAKCETLVIFTIYIVFRIHLCLPLAPSC